MRTLLLVLSGFFLVITSSCSLEKRVYRKGFYSDFSGHHATARKSIHVPEANLREVSSCKEDTTIQHVRTKQSVLTDSVRVAPNDVTGKGEIASTGKPDSPNDTIASRRISPPIETPISREDVLRHRSNAFTLFLLSLLATVLMIVGGAMWIGAMYVIGFLFAGVLAWIILFLWFRLYKLVQKFPELREGTAGSGGNFQSPYLHHSNEDAALRKLQKARRQAIWYTFISYVLIGLGSTIGIGLLIL